MDSRSTVLGPADMDGRGIETDLLPAWINHLANQQGMPEGHEDQQRSRTGFRLSPAAVSSLSISASMVLT